MHLTNFLENLLSFLEGIFQYHIFSFPHFFHHSTVFSFIYSLKYQFSFNDDISFLYSASSMNFLFTFFFYNDGTWGGLFSLKHGSEKSWLDFCGIQLKNLWFFWMRFKFEFIKLALSSQLSLLWRKLFYEWVYETFVIQRSL